MATAKYNLKRCLNPFHRNASCATKSLRRVSHNISEVLNIDKGWLFSVCRKLATEKLNSIKNKKIPGNNDILKFINFCISAHFLKHE